MLFAWPQAMESAPFFILFLRHILCGGMYLYTLGARLSLEGLEGEGGCDISPFLFFFCFLDYAFILVK
jgi:hypothetical protein